MADKATVDEVIVDTKAEETIVPEIDYKAEFERLSKESEEKSGVIDKYKKDIAGLDRKVGELTEAQKEILKQSETAEQTAKREAEERQVAWEAKQNELATKETDLRSKENALNVKLKAADLGISLDEVTELSLNSVEQLEVYKKQKEALILKTIEETTAKLNKDLSSVSRDNYTGNRSAVKKNPIMDKAVNNF